MNRLMPLAHVTLLAATLMPLTLSVAHAEGGPPNVFAAALVRGEATAPVEEVPLMQHALAALRERSGMAGPFIILAKRVARFETQSRCGRVAFALAQPSSHKVFPQLGGELNVCEDGLPPLRVCDQQPDRLVPPSSRCADGARPHDTPEVAAAIEHAVAHGSLLPRDAAARFAARAPAGSASAPAARAEQ